MDINSLSDSSQNKERERGVCVCVCVCVCVSLLKYESAPLFSVGTNIAGVRLGLSFAPNIHTDIKLLDFPRNTIAVTRIACNITITMKSAAIHTFVSV